MKLNKEMIDRHDQIMRLFERLNTILKDYFVKERSANKATYSLDTSLILFLLANPTVDLSSFIPSEILTEEAQFDEYVSTKEALEFIHANQPDREKIKTLALRIKNGIYNTLQEKTGWGKNEVWIRLEKVIDATVAVWTEDFDPDSNSDSNSEVPF